MSTEGIGGFLGESSIESLNSGAEGRVADPVVVSSVTGGVREAKREGEWRQPNVRCKRPTCMRAQAQVRPTFFIICISLGSSMPCGPLKQRIKTYSRMVMLLALTFNQVHIPALTLTRCVTLNCYFAFLNLFPNL